MSLSDQRVRVIDAFRLSHQSTVVDARVELQHLTVFLQHWNEGQEVASLEAILVEIIRCSIGGGQQHQAAVKQLLEHVAENHRVANVSHLKLVQKEKPRLAQKLGGNGGNRIEAIGNNEKQVLYYKACLQKRPYLDLLQSRTTARVLQSVLQLVAVQSVVKLQHEDMKVHSTL